MTRHRRIFGPIALGLALAFARSILGHADISSSSSDLGTVDESPSTCRLTVRSVISEKLVCPGRSVEVRYTLSVECAAGSSTTVRWIRLVSPIPEGVTPIDPGVHMGVVDDRELIWRFEHEGPMLGELIAAYQVVAAESGDYEIGAASVELIDSEGGKTSRSTAAHSLAVSDECPMSYLPREHRAYLPLVERPGCTPYATPADVVILIDRSSSVGGGGLHDPVKHARDLIESLSLSRDRAAIIAFDQRSERLTGLIRERETIMSALQLVLETGARPGTRIERALNDARRLFEIESQVGRRKIVVLISDGVQLGPGGNAPVREAAGALRDLGARILPLGIGSSPDMALLESIAGPSGSARAVSEASEVPGVGANHPGEQLAIAATCEG